MKNSSIILLSLLSDSIFANIYNTDNNLVISPLYKSIKIDKNNVIVLFDYDDGLYFLDNTLDQFEMAAADGMFYEAKATIKKNSVILHSDKVEKPVKVRFAWKNDVQSQFFNKANLPASSFTSE